MVDSSRDELRATLGLSVDQRAVAISSGHAAMRIADLASLRRDFELTHQFATAFAQLDRNKVEATSPQQALWMAAVMTYGRAFANGVRHSARASIDAYDEDQRGAHHYLIGMRNKYLAHSVNAFEQVAVFAVVSKMDSGDFRVDGVGTQHASLARLSRARALQIAQMCVLQMADIDARTDHERSAIMSDLERRGHTHIEALPDLTMLILDDSDVGRGRPRFDI